MLVFILRIVVLIILFSCLIYCIVFWIKKDQEKFNISIPAMTLLVAIISSITSTFFYTDFSDLAPFYSSDDVYINSIIYAYPEPFFTIRYTLDGSSPAKNGVLYDNGIIVSKENVINNKLTISYQIGLGDMFYFSKIYNQKYTVSDAVQLSPKSVSEYKTKNGNDQNVIVFGKCIIDDLKNGDSIIDGNEDTTEKFDKSINHTHIIKYSKPNNIPFSKLYIRQQGITQMKINIDNKYPYFCNFDNIDDAESNTLFEVDFNEKIPIQSFIKIEVSSSKSNYSVSDIWFDYYLKYDNNES